MTKTLKINEQVKVVATFDDESICQPIKMEFRGHEVNFSKFRINYANLSVGDEKVFDLFDQERRYRLIFNMDNLSWLLDSVGLRSNA
ncbi:MAG: hypothetical protein QG623_380 [Patescibacteria group bacterium]|nr:hypothetical protein [Patescibacteria group bacterium]